LLLDFFESSGGTHLFQVSGFRFQLSGFGVKVRGMGRVFV